MLITCVDCHHHNHRLVRHGVGGDDAMKSGGRMGRGLCRPWPSLDEVAEAAINPNPGPHPNPDRLESYSD